MATFFEETGGDPGDVADYTPAPAPVVSKMLELSTAHAPDADAYAWWVHGRGAVGPQGNLVWVANYASLEVPDWLEAILAHAVELRCAYIHFDADGPIDPALPFWKW